MKFITALLLGLCSITLLKAQNSFTFAVETLKPAKELLPLDTKEAIFKKMLLKDAGLWRKKNGEINVNVDSSIVSTYKSSGSLVNYGYHSFFDGMYRAYADHRPFVLSPDMIWLLIAQGFSQHINNNAEAMRKFFVKHEGKITLIVRNDKIDLKNPESPWEEVFPEFTQTISKYTGKEFTNTLTASFTTTTPASQIASQITIMDALKNYFDYVVMVVGCGIPKITIEGTAADWQKLYTKVEALEKYDLAWWTNEITPLLKEFIHAANKKVNPDFWRNMFKYHEKGSGIYKSTAIDGWMIKFFPYNKQGQRNNLDSLTGSANLPDEICKVDVLHQFIDEAGNITQTPLEFCAGFIGLKQDGANFTLKPEIGWFVKRKDSLNALIVQELEEKNKSGNIHIRVNEIPAELLGLPAISNLYVEFTGDIHIPEQMKKLSIGTLVLSGKTSDEEAQRITAMFPNTTVIINKKDYRNPGKKPSELMLGLGW